MRELARFDVGAARLHRECLRIVSIDGIHALGLRVRGFPGETGAAGSGKPVAGRGFAGWSPFPGPVRLVAFDRPSPGADGNRYVNCTSGRGVPRAASGAHPGAWNSAARAQR